MITAVITQWCGFAVNQQVEHMSFSGGIDNGQMLAVVADVQNADFKRGAVPYCRLTGLEVNLHVVLLRELAQTLAESIYRVTFGGKTDATPKANPLQTPQNFSVPLFDLGQKLIETIQIVIFAVIVNHHTVDLTEHTVYALKVALTQSTKLARRIGEIETGTTDARVEA